MAVGDAATEISFYALKDVFSSNNRTFGKCSGLFVLKNIINEEVLRGLS